MKQTAVEWLIHQMLEASINTETEEMYIKLPKDSLKQAKAMEKLQIIDAFFEGKNDGILMERYSDYEHISPDEYYNENFKLK